MRRFAYLALATVAVLSCSKTNNDISRFHEDGRTKPVVALASVIDTTSFDAPWSLSEELTSMIVDKISQGGAIYVTAKDDLGYTDQPFGSDLSWVKREFSEDQFVAFIELVEHETVAVSKGKKRIAEIPFETSTNLKMAVRLRVIDLRGQTPQIVLQEMIRDSYYIPRTLEPTNYAVATWGTDEYARSPMGLAHAGLVGEISSRISEYIQLAKSR